jgi:predicted ester cyclase
MRYEDQLAAIDPSVYAPYQDPRDYITSWTDKIWITRGLGHLKDHYAPDVQVHTAYGETYDFGHVMRNSVQRMVAFPNRGGGHDDVVWEARGNNGFISSHRVFNNATHLGHWNYGPPTGKNWVNRSVAHCLIRDGKVVEEWLTRDEYSVMQDLGLDPHVLAAQLAERSPILGKAMDGGGSDRIFGGRIADPVVEGLSGRRPDTFVAECRMVQEMFETVWNQRLFDRVTDYFADNIVCQTVRLRRVMGIAPFQLEMMSLLACFPDGEMEIRDFAVHDSFDLGLRIGVIWLLRGTYSGAPVYGPTNGAAVNILGSSHFEFRRGKIIREWRIFDEISVMAQIKRADLVKQATG